MKDQDKYKIAQQNQRMKKIKKAMFKAGAGTHEHLISMIAFDKSRLAMRQLKDKIGNGATPSQLFLGD